MCIEVNALRCIDLAKLLLQICEQARLQVALRLGARACPLNDSCYPRFRDYFVALQRKHRDVTSVALSGPQKNEIYRRIEVYDDRLARGEWLTAGEDKRLGPLFAVKGQRHDVFVAEHRRVSGLRRPR